MKAVYKTPLTEVIVYMNDNQLLAGTNNYDHADAKGFSGQDDDEEAPIKGDNLWDGWDD